MSEFEEESNAGSADSDLHRRTLGRLPSLMLQIDFLASLRRGNRYEHWGLSRRYGECEVAEAISSAHTRCFLQWLRSGSKQLMADMEAAATQTGMTLAEFALRAWERRHELTPLILEGGSVEHLHWTLFVVWKIAERSSECPDSGAWQPPRLGR